MAKEFNENPDLTPKGADEWQEYLAGEKIAEPDAAEQDKEVSILPESDSSGSALNIYLREIGKTPLLTAIDEINLAQQIEAGREAAAQLTGDGISEEKIVELQRLIDQGNEAKKRFVEANLRLVVSVARRFQNRGLDLLDLIQEGNIGLQTGVERYSWQLGYRFSTFGYHWIRQAIQRAYKNQSKNIRIPTNLYDIQSAIFLASSELTQELGRTPKLDELAQRMKIDSDRLGEILAAYQPTASLSATVGDEESTLEDIIPADFNTEDLILKDVTKDLLEEGLNKLSKRERDILYYRFGLDESKPKTLKELGTIFNIVPERIRQIEKDALKKLRKNPKLKALLLDDGRVLRAPQQQKQLPRSTSSRSLWENFTQQLESRAPQTPSSPPSPMVQIPEVSGFAIFLSQYKFLDDQEDET